MKYYRIKSGTEKPLLRILRGQLDYCGDLVETELFTPREANKYANVIENAELVEIKKTNTYVFFGCRFEA